MQRHKVNVPTEFYARFTRDVVQLAQEEGTGCEGRVISVLEGGYSDRALCSGVLSHLAGLCGRSDDEENGLVGMMGGLKMDPTVGDGQIPNGVSGNGEDTRRRSELKYDESWGSEASLTALEHRIHPPPPPGVAGKKVRNSPLHSHPHQQDCSLTTVCSSAPPAPNQPTPPRPSPSPIKSSIRRSSPVPFQVPCVKVPPPLLNLNVYRRLHLSTGSRRLWS